MEINVLLAAVRVSVRVAMAQELFGLMVKLQEEPRPLPHDERESASKGKKWFLTVPWRDGLKTEWHLNQKQEKFMSDDKKWMPGCVFAIVGMIGMFILCMILDTFFGFGLRDTKLGIILLFAVIIVIGAWLISSASGSK